MSFNRKSAENTARRILADSANARHRFGFAGEHGSPIIERTPKLSDLWFIEFKPVFGGRTYNTTHISALAKSVSPISISTSSFPIDQYGRRIFVPTRVDFPEVILTMYDTVDGQMFDMAASVYSKFFKNQDAEVTGANAEKMLTDSHEYGRKIPDSKHEYYHQHFEKVTVYHFFGNLDPFSQQELASGIKSGVNNPKNAGQGSIQKIELINPLVTNITFSPSDYSVGDIRTMDFSLQPENVIIGDETSVTFPDWMTWGMDYMLDELKAAPIYKYRWGQVYPDPFLSGYGPNTVDRFKKNITPDGTEEHVDWKGEKRVNEFGDDEHKRKQAQSLTDPLRIEEQEYNDTNRKLNELMRLYNATVSHPGEAANNEALVEALKRNIGVIDLARSNRFSKESSKTYIDEGNEFDTPYTATYTNPDIPTFGGIGDSNPAGTGYPRYSTDIGSAMIRELVGAFFGKRKFDISNIKGTIINKIIGNDGKSESKKILGSILTDGMISSKKGAYVTTTKANQSIPTNNPAVYKTNTTDQAIGVSKALLRKFLGQ